MITTFGQVEEVRAEISMSGAGFPNSDSFFFVGRMSPDLITKLMELSHRRQDLLSVLCAD